MNAAVLHFRPRPGHYWPRAGGHCVGTIGSYTLFLGPSSGKELSWEEAKQWAISLRVLGYRDFALPNLFEVELLLRVMPERFAGRRHWTSDLQPGVLADALVFAPEFGVIHFGRHYPCHARAIRRHFD